MKVIVESNLEKILDTAPSKGRMTLFPVAQEGIERTEIIKTHFLFLGEIAKIHIVEGNAKSSRNFFSKLSDVQLPIRTYSLEVSMWKVVALVALLPIFCIQRIFGASSGPLTRDVTINSVKIEASRDATGKVSMDTEKIEPIILRGTNSSKTA